MGRESPGVSVGAEHSQCVARRSWRCGPGNVPGGDEAVWREDSGLGGAVGEEGEDGFEGVRSAAFGAGWAGLRFGVNAW